MNVFSTHPSVRLKGSEDSYEPVLCAIPDCPKRLPHLHCPFCVKTDVFHDPVILKAHYRVKHVDKGIDFSGLKILRCCDHCEIVGTIKGQKAFKGAHWHCYKCRNGFNRRDEALKHYKTHFRNPMTTFQIQVQQDINQMMYIPQHVETVEVPTVGALAEDGTFYMPSNWPGAPEQMLPQPQGHDGLFTNGTTGHQMTQVGIAANETIEAGGDEYYVMEQGQGDSSLVPDHMTSASSIQTAEQWIKDLGSFSSSSAGGSRPSQPAGYTKYEPPGSESQNKDAIIANYKEQVAALQNQLAEKDKRIEQLLLREKELLAKLTSMHGLPVSEILDDLKSKQEELFNQYMSKLKPNNSACATQNSGGNHVPSNQEAEVRQQESPAGSQSDSQFSTSSRTLSSPGCQSESPLPDLSQSIPATSNQLSTDTSQPNYVITHQGQMTAGQQFIGSTVSLDSGANQFQAGSNPIQFIDGQFQTVSNPVSISKNLPGMNTAPTIRVIPPPACSSQNVLKSNLVKTPTASSSKQVSFSLGGGLMNSSPIRNVLSIPANSSKMSSPKQIRVIQATKDSSFATNFLLSLPAADGEYTILNDTSTDVSTDCIADTQQSTVDLLSGVDSSQSQAKDQDLNLGTSSTDMNTQLEEDDVIIESDDVITGSSDVFAPRRDGNAMCDTEVDSTNVSEYLTDTDSTSLNYDAADLDGKQKISLYLNESGEYIVSLPTNDSIVSSGSPAGGELTTRTITIINQGDITESLQATHEIKTEKVGQKESVESQNLETIDHFSSAPSPAQLNTPATIIRVNSPRITPATGHTTKITPLKGGVDAMLLPVTPASTPQKSAAADTLISLQSSTSVVTSPMGTSIATSRPKRKASTSPKVLLVPSPTSSLQKRHKKA